MSIKITSQDAPIVMVDDHEPDFVAASRFLKRSELKNPMIYISSGEDFLDYLDKVRAGEQPMPALVLMDINMPGMDGHETVRQTRELPEFKTLPVLVMLTSSATSKDRSKAKEAGADDYLTKPLDPREYVALFNSLVVSSS